jgi:dihydropteroate synthase
MNKYKDFHINCTSKSLDLSTPAVMGILNLTEDSFYDGGKYNTIDSALGQAAKMLEEGASIIDIGAASSKPNSKKISMEEEWAILQNILPIINKEFPKTILSVDTFHSEIAKRSVDNGADIINDISAGEMDQKMFEVIADLKVPYIMMHMQGNPQNMQDNPSYNNVSAEIVEYFKAKLQKLNQLGLKNTILDPGFGFGKTLEHNYQLLNNLNDLTSLDCPLLVGVSRKSMIYKLLDIETQDSLNGTTAIHSLCLDKGSSILRVHDVKEAVECVKISNFAKNNH